MAMRKIIIIAILLGLSPVEAGEVSLELGTGFSQFNYFQKPNINTNRVDLNYKKIISYRIKYTHDLKNNWFLSFLYAPLETNYQIKNKTPIIFNNSHYQAGKVDVFYKFNSYRVGFLKKIERKKYSYWGGLVGKIRDARIEVSQGSINDSFSNIGFVPLLSFGGEYKFRDFSLYSHTDALAAPQGSAYDTQLEIRIYKNKQSYSWGYRLLGGGVDNEKIKNFAQFQSMYFSWNIRF